MRRSFCLLSAALLTVVPSFAQQNVQGRVVDAYTKELLTGVAIYDTRTQAATYSANSGIFNIAIQSAQDTLVFSYTGYEPLSLKAATVKKSVIALTPLISDLQSVVVTAARARRSRTDEAVAISTISPETIQETNPTHLTELLDKVPGVVMQDLGNEQHAMSIRQPMTKNPYFLYLEDGVPIAPLGDFNHNQLIEVNMLGIKSIEVLKGPASSFYGSDAVGGVINFITQSPSFSPTAKIGLQANDYGYQRLEFYAGNYVTPKLGISIGGYMAKQRDGWQQYSDFDKLSLSFKTVYNINNKMKLTGYLTTNNLNTQTGGSIDSADFYTKQYLSNNQFSYRKVRATRARITLDNDWNNQNQSSFTIYYGDNTIGQLPRYRIKNISKNLAGGEENANSYNYYGALLQHDLKLNFLQSKLFAGASLGYAPTGYKANFLSIERDTVTGYYSSYKAYPDSLLADYNTDLLNAGLWLQYEITPVRNLKFIAGIRYDYISYAYTNNLNQDAYSGVPDTTIVNKAFSPKIGMVYDLGKNRGLYANYSRGLAAPQTSDLFFGRKVPDLKPAHFDSYELGGWAALWEKKVYVDVSLYQMNGFNEIISYRLPDNSTENRNAGRTLHRGIEYSITYRPFNDLFLRFGGTNAIHKYLDYNVQEKANGEIINFDGKYMPEAPKFMANAAISYKPHFIRGLRLSLEWQRIASWYKDDANDFVYDDRTFLFKGVSLLNLRTGYQFKNIEMYINILNLTDELYANSVTRRSGKDTYSAGAPRTFTYGLIYHFGGDAQ